LVLFVEGKRAGSVTPSTPWYPDRSQLWRNVEVAQQFAHGKEFGLIVGVETEEAGDEVLRHADESRDRSYPHLSPANRTQLGQHFLGYVVWPAIVRRFGLTAAG
jgi:hypothetical protein